jgi:cytochrome c oxidase subunit II
VNNHLQSTTATVDPIFFALYGVCLVLLVGITAAMLWFVIRYHRSRAPEPTSRKESSVLLEVTWTLLPTLLVLGMFYYGWAGYLALRNVPPGSLPVQATARMWSWSFQYQNGRSSNKLVVPVGRPILVSLESKDVVHGFYLPAFRVKRDVVPGMKNRVWFLAEKAGSYDLFCSQYCGAGHSAMITSVEALPVADFERWLKEEAHRDTHQGKELMQKYGCLGCHSLDGAPGVGPSLKGIFGKTEKVVRDGKHLAVTVDEGYLRESITAPQAAVVEGFQPIMPVFKEMSPDELKALVEFLEHEK